MIKVTMELLCDMYAERLDELDEADDFHSKTFCQSATKDPSRLVTFGHVSSRLDLCSA